MTDEDTTEIPDDLEEIVNALVHEQGYAGATLVVSSDEHTDTFGEIAPDRDGKLAALWMLAAFNVHVTDTLRESGHPATMESVAAEAINLAREYGG